MRRCAVLPELNPVLCRAVTGRDHAAFVLEGLYRRRLFLGARDEAVPALRFHDLFRDFLVRELAQREPGFASALHARAAAAETEATRAVPHLVAGRCWQAAVPRILQAAPALVAEGAQATVQRWIHQLPEALLSPHPERPVPAINDLYNNFFHALPGRRPLWLRLRAACARAAAAGPVHGQVLMQASSMGPEYGYGDRPALRAALNRQATARAPLKHLSATWHHTLQTQELQACLAGNPRVDLAWLLHLRGQDGTAWKVLEAVWDERLRADGIGLWLPPRVREALLALVRRRPGTGTERKRPAVGQWRGLAPGLACERAEGARGCAVLSP